MSSFVISLSLFFSVIITISSIYAMFAFQKVLLAFCRGLIFGIYDVILVIQLTYLIDKNILVQGASQNENQLINKKGFNKVYRGAYVSTGIILCAVMAFSLSISYHKAIKNKNFIFNTRLAGVKEHQKHSLPFLGWVK
jgi:hypothetical protein